MIPFGPFFSPLPLISHLNLVIHKMSYFYWIKAIIQYNHNFSCMGFKLIMVARSITTMRALERKKKNTIKHKLYWILWNFEFLSLLKSNVFYNYYFIMWPLIDQAHRLMVLILFFLHFMDLYIMLMTSLSLSFFIQLLLIWNWFVFRPNYTLWH
jgi:hypothetical protein